jgi:ABC-2 type transport system permease protein
VFVEFLKVGSDVPNWPVAMLLGIVLWNFFNEVTNNGLGSIVGRGDMIRKINFPKYVIVLASSISAFINLLLNFIIIIVFMIISGVEFHASSLLVIWYVVQLFIFGVGLAFILSSLFVKLRDMNYIWEIITQALFYGSAIIYPIATIIGQHEKLGQILLLNPIAEAIQGARHTLINEANPTIASYTGNGWLTLIPLGIIIVVFVFGAWYFKKQSPYFAENI